MDYTEWMDGENGYRAWWEARYGDGATAAKGDGPVTNVGSEGPPPSPPPKHQ